MGKTALSRNAYRLGRRLQTLAFIEGGNGMKRWHAHICFETPPGMSPVDFQARARMATARLVWLRPQTDFRPIKPGTLPHALAYLLKEGELAFAPEASCI